MFSKDLRPAKGKKEMQEAFEDCMEIVNEIIDLPVQIL